MFRDNYWNELYLINFVKFNASCDNINRFDMSLDVLLFKLIGGNNI